MRGVRARQGRADDTRVERTKVARSSPAAFEEMSGVQSEHSEERWLRSHHLYVHTGLRDWALAAQLR